MSTGFALTLGPAGGATVDLGDGGQVFIERGGDNQIPTATASGYAARWFDPRTGEEFILP